MATDSDIEQIESPRGGSSRYRTPSISGPVETPLLGADVISKLRLAILRGEFEPGMHLTERGTGEAFGVSSIVMREAFARLEEEGLVERKPRRGAFVTAADIGELAELTQVRVVIEQLAVELAMKHWSPETDALVQGIVDEMFDAAKAADTERFHLLDERFHEAFARAAGNAVLLEVSAHLRRRVARFLLRSAILLEGPALVRSAEVHARWLEAVRTGPPRAALKEVRQHIDDAFERMRASLTDGAGTGRS